MYYEERLFDGVLYYRIVEGGAFRKKHDTLDRRRRCNEHPIDHLMLEIQQRLGLTTRGDTLDAINFDSAGLSRVRTNKEGLSAKIILNIHDATGMSIADIRRIGCLAGPEVCMAHLKEEI